MTTSRLVGTAAFGVRAPIIREGDDLVTIVADSLLQAQHSGAVTIRDHDVVGVTESLVARAQGNYASIDAVASDAAAKLPGDFVVLSPILSRNRFSVILKGLARSGRKITVMLNYPCDEVGNHLMDVDEMDAAGINPYTDVLTEADYRRHFGHRFKHPFTGLDYIDLYKSLAVDGNIEVVLANDYRAALRFAPHVLVANIHARARLKRQLLKAGAKTAIGLADLLTEVMAYGDGAFKDPQGKIWELADPVVSPGYTDGLSGMPSEIKMKYVVDNELAGLDRAATAEALRQKIRGKSADLVGQEASLGTTPRQLTDLLGSLCDLISGSGDKGTPIILVQGYFDNFASD